MNASDALAELCRLYLVWVMGVACLAKVVGFGAFTNGLSQWGLRRPFARAGLAACICLVEGGLSVLLATRRFPEFTAWMTMAFFLAGALAVAWAIMMRPGVRCHCFGSSGETITPVTLVRNLFLLGAAAVPTLAPKTVSPTFPDTVLLGLVALLLLQITVNVPAIAAFGGGGARASGAS